VVESVKIHCPLADKDVTLAVSGGGAMLALRMDPSVYQSGFKCPREETCRSEKISCLVFEDRGRAPFDDSDLLNVYDTLQNYREHLLARIIAFSAMGVKYLKMKSEDRTASTEEERLEIAYMLRFYTGNAARVWPALKIFLTPERLNSEPSAAMEAYYSVCYWIEHKKIPESARTDILRALVEMKKTLTAAKDGGDAKFNVAEESINAVIDVLARGK
jgi:hypothetical protein